MKETVLNGFRSAAAMMLVFVIGWYTLRAFYNPTTTVHPFLIGWLTGMFTMVGALAVQRKI